MLDKTLQHLADEAGATAVAVSFHDLETGRQWAFGGSRPFHAASTMKVGVLMALLAAVSAGRFRLHDRLHVRNRFHSAADGSVYHVDAGRDANDAVYERRGRTMRLDRLAEHMIQTSSNLATNLLVDLLGVEPIRAAVHAFGGAGLEVLRGVEDEKAFEAGLVSTTTADALARLFVAIETGTGERGETGTGETGEGPGGEALRPDLRQVALDILMGQAFSSGIPAGLPDAVRERSRFAHKTGSISTVQHDAGLVYLPDRRPYALAVLTEWPAQKTEGRRATVAACSRAVYAHFVAGEHPPDPALAADA